MLLLAPLFLLGLLLLALPWWLHRLQTEIPETESFPSTMLLEASTKRVHVRKKLRYLLLFAARLLLLALLVLAFSRPAIKQSLVASDPNSAIHLIVLDASASMGAAGNIGAARSNALRIVNSLAADQRAQILRADSTLNRLTEATTDKGNLTAAINNLDASLVATSFAEIISGVDDIMQASNERFELHIISDFQASAMPARFSALVPTGNSQGFALNLHQINISQMANRSIESVSIDNNELRVGVRARNADPAEVTIEVNINQQNSANKTLSLPADGRNSVTYPLPELNTGNNQIKVSLLEEDTLISDNEFYFTHDISEAAAVLHLSANPEALSSTYLGAVFSGNQENSDSPFQLETETISTFDARRLARYSWIIIDDIGSVSASLADELRNYVSAGGAIFAASAQQTLNARDLPLTQHTLSAARLTAQDEFSTISSVDTTHPALNSMTGWSNVTITDQTIVEPLDSDQVLIRLSNGAPLMIEQKIGGGKLIWLTSSLNNDWNDLPVKPLFVGLMSEMAKYLSNAEQWESQRYAGQTLGIARTNNNTGQLIDPQGNKTLKLGEQFNSAQLRLTQTGFYTALNQSGEQVIGVNINPLESDLTRQTEAQLNSWQDAANRTVQTVVSETTDVAETNQNKELWMMIFLAAIIILILESLLGNFLIRRPLINSKVN